jgi:hypothetical protein
MIWPIVEHAHFGTTRYTTLSLSVIQVPGKLAKFKSPYAAYALQSPKEQRNAVTSMSVRAMTL